MSIAEWGNAALFKEYAEASMSGKKRNLNPGDLTPRRLQRFYRTQIQGYVSQGKLPTRLSILGLGEVLKTAETPGANQNSQPIRLAQVGFPDGSEVTAYIPRGVKGVTEGTPVWVRASRSPKVPGIFFRVKPLPAKHFSGGDLALQMVKSSHRITL